ncbi:cytochrome c family protein, partial [Pyxidicoccus fallax]
PPSYSCGSSKNLTFGPYIPPDMSQVFSQTDANCFAWRQFIALNWPASNLDGGSPDAGFGTAGDLSPVQWQTYMSTALLFPPDGGMPPPWGTQPEISADCLAEANVTAAQAKRLLPLMQSSKFTEQFSGNSQNQAFPFSGPSWLGAQNGTNVWYDVRVSQPEYDYVVDAGLYNANNQVAMVDGGAGSPLLLPAGSFSTNVGSIELKSAWMEAPDARDAKWNSYKLAPAVVADPETQKCRVTTVALVGLHIIHKTAGQPGFVWTTFEHVNNAPDEGTDAGTTNWNFYSAQCQPKRVQLAAHCSTDGGATEVTVGCTPNVPPPYYIGGGCPEPLPIQVTRLTPIDATAQSVNQVMQQQIGQAYPGSVWGSYMLVNTLWSTNPSPDPTRPVKKPLPFSGAAPSANTPIANTTMETYLQVKGPDSKNPQQVSNCIACHENASIAGGSGWASDFSFIFGLASAPPSPATKKKTPSLRATPVDTRPRMRNILH